MFGLRSKSWTRRQRLMLLGENVRAAQWVDGVAKTRQWSPSVWTVARVAFSWTCRRTWRGMRLCIAWICEKTGYSRTAVKEALKFLRSEGFMAHDGQIEVNRTRKVNKWRACGTPEFPLPEDVIMARKEDHEAEMSITPEWEETPGQGRSDHTKNSGDVIATQEIKGECLSLINFKKKTGGFTLYRSTESIRTEPKAKTGHTARRPTHLFDPREVARSIAAAARYRIMNPGVDSRALERARLDRRQPKPSAKTSVTLSARLAGLFSPYGVASTPNPKIKPSFQVDAWPTSEVEVSYGNHTTEGVPMNPFQDFTLGRLDRDTRLFYLGVLYLFQTTGPVLADPLFLKAQIFPYDSDFGDEYGPVEEAVSMMTAKLINAGKLVMTDGRLIVPDALTPGSAPDALFEAPRVIPAPKRKRTPLAARDSGFQEFWNTYPRREAIGAAEKAFIAAIGNGATAEEIIEGAIRYRDNCIAIRKEKRFIPHPSVWLGQRRWLDDAEEAEQVHSKADNAMRANLSLVEYYEQQEALASSVGMLEIES